MGIFKRIRYALERPGPRVDRTKSNIGKTEWIDSGAWAWVTSSLVRAMKYDKEAQTLHVQFYDLFVAAYPNVTPQEAMAMFRATSVGKHARKAFWPPPGSRTGGKPYHASDQRP